MLLASLWADAIRSQTPEEIAVSIADEIIAFRNRDL